MRSYLMMVAIACLFLACKESTEKTTKKSPLVNNPNTAQLATDSNTAASDDIEVIPISHASAILRWNGLHIYIDPVGGAALYADYEGPDIILVTDIHGDHFDLATLEGLPTADAKIMVPSAVAEKMPDNFTPQMDILDNGDEKERYGVLVEAIPMYNLREEAKKFHEKGRGNGYVLTLGSQKVYFSGDTEDIPEMRALEAIDMAFVCMNLPYTMTVEKAADAVLEFKPKKVYPYHYRGRPEVSDVRRFKKLVDEANTNIAVIQLDWYPGEDY